MQRTQAIGLILVALALGFVVGFKSGQQSLPAVQEGAVCPPAPAVAAPETAAAPVEGSVSTGLPRLVDLGSTTCIPCKEMAPILEELKAEYAGKVEVEFINVNENTDAADEYKINVIPTQIFLDKDGSEVYRHEGFMPKADIVAQFEKMGVQTNQGPGE